MEEEQELLRGINDKTRNTNINNTSIGYNSGGGLNTSMQGGLKSHRFTKAQVEEEKRITRLRVENGVLSDKLKAINVQIDEFVREHLQQKTARKNSHQLDQQREAYLQSMENQLKVNERMVEQYVLEKAKMQMRMEQLENPNYMHEVKEEIERTTKEIS